MDRDDSATATAFYQENGWYATDHLLPVDLVDGAARTVRLLASGERDRRLPASLAGFLQWPPGEPRPVRLNQYIAFQYESIFQLASYSELGRMAALLSGSDQVRLFNTALIVKRPGAESRYARVGWHCDQSYWTTCSSDRMITAWVPLQDTTVAMGALTVLSGSHRWPTSAGLEALRQTRTFVSDDYDALHQQLQALGLPFDLTMIELSKGEVSFHHPLTYHSSGVNRSDRTRAAISVHFQDGKNHYRASADSSGAAQSYVHDQFVRRLPNGDPDYADPAICPLVWPVGNETASGLSASIAIGSGTELSLHTTGPTGAQTSK